MVVLENLESESSFAPLWFHHLSNLDEEDKDIEELFENFEGPDEVFPYVVSLKEEGNALFILEDFGNAFTIYSKAIKSLCIAVSAVCDDDVSACENDPLFRDLIISITLNMAACAIKLNKLSEAIVYCSLILEADAKNVKALFRKGLAFEKLGKLGEAYEELRKARSLEPKNEEIVKKISEVQRLLSQTEKLEGPNEKDLGSELGSQPHKSLDLQDEKPKTGKLKLETNIEHLDDVVEGSESKDHTSNISRELVGGIASLKNNINYPMGLGSGLPPRKEPPKDGVIRDTIMKDVSANESLKQGVRMDDRKVNGQEDDSGSRINVASSKETYVFAEPKYRFCNRKRRGSFMMIPRKVYQSIAEGKSDSFQEPRTGSILEIRVVGVREDSSSSVGKEQKEKETLPMISSSSFVSCQESKSSEVSYGMGNNLEDNTQMEYSGGGLSEEDDTAKIRSIGSAYNPTSTDEVKKDSWFAFSSKSNLCSRASNERSTLMIRKTSAGGEAVQQPPQVNWCKKRKVARGRTIKHFTSNFDCDCRLRAGVKRKSTTLPTTDCFDRPSKICVLDRISSASSFETMCTYPSVKCVS